MTLGNIYPAVLTLVLVGIILGIGIYMMDQTRQQIAIDYVGLDNSTNASSVLNTSTLSTAGLTSFYLNPGSVSVINSSSNTAVTNYTVTTGAGGGVFVWGDDLIFPVANHTIVNISYTYNYDAADTPETAMTTAIAGVGDFADWIAIIVVVIAAAIVLGVVLSSFGRKPGI